MLTRLKVSGFKNLVAVDVRFGAFTCIAGSNGVGKSNLFDAIRFLSALAEMPLLEAALSVRGEGGRMADVRSLFHTIVDDYVPQMTFEAEMIIPSQGLDDLNQKAEASITFVRYSVTLAYQEGGRFQSLGGLELLKEELVHINLTDAQQHLSFPHAKSWRKSAILGKRTAPFISTDEQKGQISLHQDKNQGKPRPFLAKDLPRTVLSIPNAAESPTVLLARREMQSWRLLQLEPSALRKPDEFTAPAKMGLNGAHLPATLYRLATQAEVPGGYNRVQQHIANKLSLLIDDVAAVWVDRDDARQLLTLQVTDRNNTTYSGQSLSDGTLRFLALSVLERDPEAQGVLCLEEPENGIHPGRIPAILRLLQDIAVDVEEPVQADNPLRQVIINTHSPAVVAQVPDESLLVAELKESIRDGERFKSVHFSPLPGTWRDTNDSVAVARGKLLTYLNPIEPLSNGDSPTRRVIDREDVRQILQLSD